MRIKSLSIIASSLVFSLAVTSCLDSNNNYELSSDNLITAFSLDTIYGVTYNFTIDQIKGEIYNIDSVAYGADTIINKILIKTLTTNGLVTTGTDIAAPYSKDTVFNYTDSIDFITHDPLVIRVRSYDGLYIKQYSIWVRVHKTDPDSLVWWNDASTNLFKDITPTESKAVLLKDQVLVFASDGTQATVYPEKNQWQKTDIAKAIKVSSIVNLNNTLYTVGDDREIYYSADGETWTRATSAWKDVAETDPITVDKLLTTFKDKDGEYLSAIINGVLFATAKPGAAGTLTWTKGSTVPDNFPTTHIVATKAFTTPTGGQQALLIGEAAADATATTPWFSTEGLSWGILTPSKAKYALPAMREPSILYYGKTIYAFGQTTDGFSYIYTSQNGIVWEKIRKKFVFPLESDGTSTFKEKSGYAMTVDQDNYIRMFWYEGGEAWKGKLNRLGFKIQD
jgi:hypothetical protein